MTRDRARRQNYGTVSQHPSSGEGGDSLPIENTTMFLDGNEGVTESESVVQSWADQSGSGNGLSTISGNSPTYSAADGDGNRWVECGARAGSPAIAQFEGSDLTSLVGTSDGYMAAVVKNAASGSLSVYWRQWTDTTNDDRWAILKSASNSITLNVVSTDSSSAGSATTAPMLIEYKVESGSSSIRVNNGSWIANGVGPNIFTPSVLALGDAMDYGLVVSRKTILSSAEFTSFHNYLQSRFSGLPEL